MPFCETSSARRRDQSWKQLRVIDRAAAYAADELSRDRFLRDMERSQFIERLSYHYDSWNYIHPFREGNGRTQRVFWTRVGRDAGWDIDWRSVRGDVNDDACRRAADDGDLGPLIVMFDSLVRPCSTAE